MAQGPGSNAGGSAKMLNRDTLGLIESREESPEQGEALDVSAKPPPKIRYEKEKIPW